MSDALTKLRKKLRGSEFFRDVLGHEHFVEIIRFIAEVEADRAWRPIETAPKGRFHLSDCALHNEPALPAGRCSCPAGPKHVVVLVYGPAGVRFAYQDERGQWRKLHHTPMNARPTHWMPLPPAPKVTDDR